MPLARLRTTLSRLLKIDDGDRLAPVLQVLLALTFGLLLLAGFASALMATRAGEASRWVAHTIEVRQVARELMSAVQDAEIGQRGYLLTEDPDYLEPYTRAVAAIPSTLERLRSQTLDNPSQLAKLSAIELTLEKRLSILDRTLGLAKRGQRGEAIATVKAGEGKDAMEALRTQIADFMQTELSLLSERQASADSIRRWLLALIGFTLATAAALGLLVASSARHYIERLRQRTQRARSGGQAQKSDRGYAAPGAEDRGRGAALRRHRARLQQSPHHHHGQPRHDRAPDRGGQAR